jgi:hypothetical protein
VLLAVDLDGHFNFTLWIRLLRLMEKLCWFFGSEAFFEGLGNPRGCGGKEGERKESFRRLTWMYRVVIECKRFELIWMKAWGISAIQIEVDGSSLSWLNMLVINHFLNYLLRVRRLNWSHDIELCSRTSQKIHNSQTFPQFSIDSNLLSSSSLLFFPRQTSSNISTSPNLQTANHLTNVLRKTFPTTSKLKNSSS